MDRLQPREPTKTANDLKTNLFRKLEKYKEIINNEIENLYILNNEKKEHIIMLNIECSMFCFQISKLIVNVQISKLKLELW